jgi:hypothetical protein
VHQLPPKIPAASWHDNCDDASPILSYGFLMIVSRSAFFDLSFFAPSNLAL